MRTTLRSPLFRNSVFGSLVGMTLLMPIGSRGAVQSGEDHPPAKVPAGVILVKGAWSSASDPVTPVPEGGTVTRQQYDSSYFRLSYPLPAGWIQKYEGPPPSDSGYYVLAQIQPTDMARAASRGTVLITAQDMFFSQIPAHDAQELISYTKAHLRADYVVDRQPAEVSIGGHSFVRLDYRSPVAELHWTVLATQIRCHTVQFTFTSTDTGLIGRLTTAMDEMKLPAEAGLTAGSGGNEGPVCVNGYASGANVLSRVDPMFGERRYNPIPVRVIIDTRGKVKHVHFISAFPDQAKAITEALQQWRFKPYVRDGKPVEVETGILFGRTSASSTMARSAAPP
jgi:hypothetical protein